MAVAATNDRETASLDWKPTAETTMNRKPLFAALALLLAHGSAIAADRPAMDIEDQSAWKTQSLRNAHPDVRWRLEALQVLEQGNASLARSYLERAARFGDKPSQALMAELYWSGRGGAQDRALGYAWMDLAAERGNELFAAWRERYWAELDADGRERALEVGKMVYAGFGDAVAKPRLENVLLRQRRQGTGSRTGSSIGVRVYEAPSVNTRGVGMIDSTGKKIPLGRHIPRYYEDKFWKPDQYWAWKEAVLDQSITALKGGSVTIGDLEADNLESDPP